MTFRVTPYHMSQRALAAAQRHMTRIGRAQLSTVTGLRINRPSDDPIATRSILTHRTLTERLDSDKRNVEHSRTLLNVSVSRLVDAKDILVQAKSIALEASQSLERDLLADQVDLMVDRVRQLANSTFNGHYLFSGTSVFEKPFLEDANNGTVHYEGGEDNTHTVLGIDLSVDVLYSGSTIFQSPVREVTTYEGATGVVPGSGTDSAVGRGTLTVQHTTTTITGGSGLLNGDNTSLDTIIGAPGTHTLTITDTAGDGSAGTVSLNGGPPVNFLSSDTNLEVTGRNGEVIYLNTTAITPGFNGDVGVNANGTLSVDGGLSTIAVDFSANQTVVHSETGLVTYVDTQNILRAGEETLVYRGTADVFQTLQFLSSDLRNVERSDAEWQTLISQAIGDLDRHIDQILSVVGEQSTVLQGLDGIEARYDLVQLETEGIIGALESADLAANVVEIQSQQELLQLTYATTSTLFDLNILNFI